MTGHRQEQGRGQVENMTRDGDAQIASGNGKGREQRAAGTVRAAKKGGIPLYYQVMRGLKEQILSGKLNPGQQLPSEAQLTQRFHVSRVVVRQALQILDEQGLITRVRGKGTYVSQKVAEDATPRISGSAEDLICMGSERRSTRKRGRQ